MTTSTLAQTPASSTAHPIVPRKIQVDWSASPVHWIKDEAFASHLINEIHLLLPAGEFWFCKLFNKALPLITDDKLRADVQAFIRQEAMHARAHEQATEHYLKAHGINPDDYTRRVNYLFNEGPLADAPFGIRIPERFERDWLVFRLGFVACIEHSTCVLGNYVLDNQAWEDQGDPTVLDMLRWHGAEEVEHRCVAFDVARHLGSRYLTRFLHNAVFVPGFILVWSAGAVHIMRQDKTLQPQRPSLLRPWFWREWARSSERALVPSVPWLVKEMSRYLAWGYDPVREAHTRKAQDFFERTRATGVALH